MSLKFGTDGWRAIIADEYTFSNVRKVAFSIGNYIINNGWKDREILVGYDTRFLSDAFARETAIMLSSMGLDVVLSNCYLPTPALSYTVVNRQAIGGIMVTASHNPPEYNGMKFKSSYGGSAKAEITNQIQQEINKIVGEIEEPRCSQVSVVNFKDEYVNRLRKMIDWSSITWFQPKVAVDPMHGATIGYLSDILSLYRIETILVNSEINPAFDGKNPDPIESNLANLMKAVTKNKCFIGLASDGDGDRSGAVDENGRYVGSQELFPLLLYYLAHTQEQGGLVVKTVSTTSLIDNICKDLGLTLITTPVGFKYIADL